MKTTIVAPRVSPLVNRFHGNVRPDLLKVFLDSIWASLLAHLADPVRVDENDQCRSVTFMGAIGFTIDKHSGRVELSRLEKKNGEIVFVHDNKSTVIDLPAKLTGYWLDPFLVPWRKPIADCWIGPTASDPEWHQAIKRELQRALGRSTNWYRLRCALRDALQLDPQVMRWCRKGRPSYRYFVTQREYNQVLSLRATYQRIQDDNPNLIWLYNFLNAEKLAPVGDQPVAGMKAWLLGYKRISEACWRLIANGKEQDFQHLIDFVDADGGIEDRHSRLPKWLRMIGALRLERPVPRPLLGLFAHDMFDARLLEEGYRVRFRGVSIQPGVLRAILQEGERRIQNRSHQKFMEDDVGEIVTWLEAAKPILDKNQLRQGWKYLASRASKWKVECEASDTLKDLAWDCLLPETTVGSWAIVPLTDAWQLRREALTRRHCADHYLEECLAGTCRLFAVRSKQGKPVATIGLERRGKHWAIFGFRGFANREVSEDLRGLDEEVLRRYTDLWQLTLPPDAELPAASPVRKPRAKRSLSRRGVEKLGHNQIALLECLASLPNMVAPSMRHWIGRTMHLGEQSGERLYFANLLRACHSISRQWVTSRRVGASIENRITDRGLGVVRGAIPVDIRGRGPYCPHEAMLTSALPAGREA